VSQPSSPEGAEVAIVAGAGPGSIGFAVSEQLAKSGRVVATCARSTDGLPGDFQKSVDVADRREVDAFVDEVVQRYGRLDVMVCSAGVRSIVPNDELDDAEWQRVLGINLIGAFNICHAAGRVMRSAGYGRIVTVSSIAGQVGGTMVNAAYSASKAGLIGMTKALAKELAVHGVTVNCVAPGTIDTPFIGDYDDAERKRLQDLIPVGRLGTAADVAAAVQYLCSREAGWITAATIDINGGQVVR
jgi:NAD(P)-dependent dehydrogenase (short-subunit alcohol dehydrogenase family)